MWIASTLGFFSITVSPVDGRIQARARVKTDLDELRDYLHTHDVQLSETLITQDADYRYRAFLDKEQLPAAMAALAETVSYSNFKGEISKTENQTHKLHAYHQVWAAMEKLQ